MVCWSASPAWYCVPAAAAADPLPGSSALYKVGRDTTRLLLATGDLVTAWLPVRQAEVALGALAGEVSERDRHSYEGKLAAARFSTTRVLPRLSSERLIVESTDNALMEVDEAAS